MQVLKWNYFAWFWNFKVVHIALNLLNSSGSWFGLQNTLVAQLIWLAKGKKDTSQWNSVFLYQACNRHNNYYLFLLVFTISQLNKATFFFNHKFRLPTYSVASYILYIVALSFSILVHAFVWGSNFMTIYDDSKELYTLKLSSSWKHILLCVSLYFHTLLLFFNISLLAINLNTYEGT